MFIGSNLTIFKLEPATHSTSQQGSQTRAICCVEMLRSFGRGFSISIIGFAMGSKQVFPNMQFLEMSFRNFWVLVHCRVPILFCFVFFFFWNNFWHYQTWSDYPLKALISRSFIATKDFSYYFLHLNKTKFLQKVRPSLLFVHCCRIYLITVTSNFFIPRGTGMWGLNACREFVFCVNIVISNVSAK